MSESKGARREELRAARRALEALPAGEIVELVGRPLLLYELRRYPRSKEGAKAARSDLPFLFKAFETGQAPPPRGVATSLVDAPRAATIHEYLDWTVTAEEASTDEELDFGGFRVVVLLPRFKPGWPPPGAYEDEAPKRCKALGAPRNPLPLLMPNGKPICAATIRAGDRFLEVPFFATQETRRNRGFGRALLEAIEEVARALALPNLLLCSTDDPVTRNTWRALGFSLSSEQDLHALGVQHGDLLHMDNTVQMHKPVPPARAWRSLVVRHQHWRQRLYYLPAAATAAAARQAAAAGAAVLAANGAAAAGGAAEGGAALGAAAAGPAAAAKDAVPAAAVEGAGLAVAAGAAGAAPAEAGAAAARAPD